MPHEEDDFLIKEERRVKRFDLKNALSSILESFNLERGIVFTIKSLIVSPGKSTRHYLSIGRLRYISPFRLLVVSTTLLVLIFNYTNFNPSLQIGVSDGTAVEPSSIPETQFQDGYEIGSSAVGKELNEAKRKGVMAQSQKVGETIQNYFNLVIWLYIPIVSFFTWLFNRKRDLNYAEHLIFNTFYTSMINLLTLIFFLVSVVDYRVIYALYLLFSILYFIFYYRDLLQKSWLRSAWEALVITLFSFIIYTLALSVGLVALL